MSKNSNEEGFCLPSNKHHQMDMALLSLRIGLKAYYSLYQQIRSQLHLFLPLGKNAHHHCDPGDKDDQLEDRKKAHLQEPYLETYIEVVFHFQHFIELTLKELLRQEHELLANTAFREHIIFYNLLKGEEINVKDTKKLQSVEFSVAKDRVIELIKAEKIKNHKDLVFIKDNKGFLDEIGNLRNKLVHRGAFVLFYDELDLLVGKRIFPFVDKLLELEVFKETKLRWMHQDLAAGFNPMTKIIEECKKNEPNLLKLALIKEMGRSAYQIPKRSFGWKQERDRKEKTAQDFVNSGNRFDPFDVHFCPVCGYKTLFRDLDNIEPEPVAEADYQITEIYCDICSFSIDRKLGPTCFDELPMQNYWDIRLGRE